MKTFLLIIAICICSTQLVFSQEDGVASLAIPVRSSLKFNRYLTNPTFSFVREQNTYINITNKREWVQFEDAPETYVINYSGRFRENIGIGVGLFQQNYGVLTSFGGVLNVAYNARLQQDSNLTFGLNIGFYKSSINDGNVVTNTPDPSLENIPSNTVLSISPGINYGLLFFDFGLSVNNLVQYNIKSSEMIKDDPQQSIQAHIMYTGYMYSRGFFDNSKFSALVKSEFKQEETIISGIAMLTVPKGIWAQVGYNTVYGVTGGLGLNITKQISVEYNYEKAIGDLATFGSSHEFTLAYKFKSRDRYDYAGDDEEEAMLIKDKKRKPVASTKPKLDAEARAQLAEQKALERAAIQEEARLAAEAKALAKIEAEEQARLAAEATTAQAQADEEARLTAEAAAQAQADEEARLAAEAAAQAQADEEARLAAEATAQAQADEEARLAAIAAAQAQADEQARLAAIAAAQAQADEEARLVAEAAAQAQADEEARLEAEAAAQAQADEEARLAAEVAVQAQADTDVTQKDDLAKSMFAITEATKDSKEEQDALLIRLNEVVITKEKDLKDLKEENDLSEQGIYMEPKPFKSISAENRALEALKLELDESISKRNKAIIDLENLYNERLKKVSNKNDETNQYYLDAIQTLKTEQTESERAKASLASTLETIKVATEIERKRRIKRAVYDNEKDRYLKDIAALERIKENTPLSTTPLKPEDFDFGEEQTSNVQILKGVQNVDNGYYMIIAVHQNVSDRDAFLEKAVSAGQTNINFFYDVNSSKYFIYYDKFEYVEEAMSALSTKGSKPYNGKMSVVKIED